MGSMRVVARFSKLLAATLAALPVLTPPLAAATYNITTLVEDDTNNGNCTLREALIASATDTTQDLCVGDADNDRILLQATGVYLLDDAPITLVGRQLLVRGDLANPESDYVINLGVNERFLDVSGTADLSLENLTLSSGNATGRGGALRVVDSDLAMRDVTVLGSLANHGGGISFEAAGAQTLDLERVSFEGNHAEGTTTARGGGLYVDLFNGGTVRLVQTTFFENVVLATVEDATGRDGGGLYLSAGGEVGIELRGVEFKDNTLTAPKFATGGGATMSVFGTGEVVAEDLAFAGNSVSPAVISNNSPGLLLNVTGPSLTLRRLRAEGNTNGGEKQQVVIQVGDGTQATLSDMLVAGGNGSGLHLNAFGVSCSMVAGNLTVTGNPQYGLTLGQSGCPLRVENSIVSGNAFVAQQQIGTFGGTPDVSAETQAMVGVDPHFVDAGNGDYRLASDSDAIDAGDQSFDSVGPFDLGHATRVFGDDVDLGAFEAGAIFADGFESGDLYAWTSAAP